jgi:hypothetical protein
MIKPKNKCDFCKHWTGRSCMVTPNSYYCKEAYDEYQQYIRGTQQQTQIKSLRNWDRR